MTMKSFAPPFFNHFSLSINKKKACSNENYDKETKHFTLKLSIYYILEQEILTGANADIAKTKRDKCIVFVAER